ncbi:MAG: aminopeptidase P family protein [Pseudomonadota bacterium]
MTTNLQLLKSTLEKYNLDGFIIPSNDEFFSEYTPESGKRLKWLTGFSGSNGTAIILTDQASNAENKETDALFTDGRYLLQARNQCPEFKIYNQENIKSPESWLNKHTKKGAVIGFDPRLHNLETLNNIQLNAPHVKLVSVSKNPIDELWQDRPQKTKSTVRMQVRKYSGTPSMVKINDLLEEMKKDGGDAVLITQPSTVCWLMNIRGKDVDYTPLVNCYATLEPNWIVTLYIEEERVHRKIIKHFGGRTLLDKPEQFVPSLERFAGKKVLCDVETTSFYLIKKLESLGAEVVDWNKHNTMVVQKNKVEIAGTKAAHLRDGLALTRCLFWIDEQISAKADLSELDIVAKLEECRKEASGALYNGPSFASIVGSGSNGAIIHYQPSVETNKKIEYDTLLLIDSGGQYDDGTTDVTRTLAIGTPSDEMRHNFTLALKGHIALASAIFPVYTRGVHLDALARQFLWQEKLDYKHGTGHGVGCYLSVHEGVHRIAKENADSHIPPHVIVSNEPGYYKEGEYGIRIENLMLVKTLYDKTGDDEDFSDDFLAFETLTLAPIDNNLIEIELLTKQEKTWLNNYHARVFSEFADKLDEKGQAWLKEKCKEL